MPVSKSPPLPSSWALRAALSGIVACGLGALLGTARYLTLPDATANDWDHMPLALVLFVIVSGISLGVSVGAATLIAVRRGARVPGLMAAGALGGLMAGVAPGILGIAGFGSRNAPYAGTANILGSALVGAIVFVALWSPQLFARRSKVSRVRHLGHAALASIVSLGSFGMVAWSLVLALGWVPSFDTIADLALSVGLLPFAIVVGALVSACGGAAIGAACGLVARMNR